MSSALFRFMVYRSAKKPLFRVVGDTSKVLHHYCQYFHLAIQSFSTIWFRGELLRRIKDATHLKFNPEESIRKDLNG